MIQIDAPINPGNGGGLFDLRGRLVGIPTSILGPIPGSAGYRLRRVTGGGSRPPALPRREPTGRTCTRWTTAPSSAASRRRSRPPAPRPASGWRPSCTSCGGRSWARTACSTACSCRCWRAGTCCSRRAGARQDAHARDRRAGQRRPLPPHPGLPDLVPPTSSAGRCSTVTATSTRLGPVFANFVLADEINRAPAKVQSALLEVSRGPQHGKRPTPHARPSSGCHAEPHRERGRRHRRRRVHGRREAIVATPGPDEGEEIVIAWPPTRPSRASSSTPPRSSSCRRSPTRFVIHRVRQYAARLVNATREPAQEGLGDLEPYLDLGGSPRASLALIRGARWPSSAGGTTSCPRTCTASSTTCCGTR